MANNELVVANLRKLLGTMTYANTSPLHYNVYSKIKYL